MDIRRSLPIPILWALSLSGVCVLFVIIAIGCMTHYEALYEEMKVKEETKNINYAVQSEYLHSPEAKLLEYIYDEANWSDQVYGSIRNSPLVLSNSSGTTDDLTLTLIGSSESFFTWYNELHEMIPCQIYIESIVVTGTSISFRCHITPITKGI